MLKPAAQIRTWFVNHFQHLQSNNAGNPEQNDLLLLFACYKHRQIPGRISEDLSSAQEICGTKFDLSNQIMVLCHFMPYLSESDLWLEVRAGNAMTERYGVALQHTTYYLLQLQKDTLLELLNVSDSGRAILYTPVMRLIQAVLPAFLDRSPRTTDLYFLVMLTSPVLRNFDTGYWGVPIREKLSRYTQEVSMIFTTLVNTSAHYHLNVCARTVYTHPRLIFFCQNLTRHSKSFLSSTIPPLWTI